MAASIDELYSLLIPLDAERLIVPRACVAEVVRFTAPDAVPDLPPWHLGLMNWNGRELPLISFEALQDNAVPEMSGRTRIVIFHALAQQLRARFFGIVTQGFPQLVRVNDEVLKLEDGTTQPDDSPVICKVRMINEYPLIPDLELIERRIAEFDE